MDFDKFGCPECGEVNWEADDAGTAECPDCGETIVVVSCEVCDSLVPRENASPHYGGYGGYRCDNC